MSGQTSTDHIVVISGIGLFTPLGASVGDVRDAVMRGRSSIVPSLNIDQDELHCLTSEFPREQKFDLPAELTSLTDRGVWFAIKALDEAMADARLKPSALDPERTAVVVGTSHSGIHHSEKILRAALNGQLAEITANDFYAALTDHVATIVCQYLDLKGIKATISSACSSSNTAVGYGRDLLLSGQADRVIVIGTDTVSESIAAGFNSLKVLSKFPAAPFSNPSGISLGEGAGVLILEGVDALRDPARCARHHGEVLGYALSSDAFHQTSVDENGEGIEAAMTNALVNAGVGVADIDYISAHGTGTDSNDVPESNAVARLFGSKVKISSVKSSVGHTLGASGVIELIISLACAERGLFAPNNHFTGVREGCADLAYVHGDQEPSAYNTILCNNYGFGGNNSSLVVSMREGVFTKKHPLHRPVFVSAYSNYTERCAGQQDWVELLERGLEPAANDASHTYIGRAPMPVGDKSSPRRSSPSIQFAVQAVENAIQRFGLQQVVEEKRYETGLVAGLLHGAQKAVEKYMFSVYEDGLRYARSMQFPLTTLNALAGEVAIRFGIKGFNTTLCGSVGAMKFAFDVTRMGHQERVLAVSSDEFTPLVVDMCEQFKVLGRFTPAGPGTGFYLNDGASVSVFESGQGVQRRGGSRLAEISAFCTAQDGNGHHLNDSGGGLARVGVRALRESGIAASEVDLVVGVGQGTKPYLRNERQALDAIFGEAVPTMTSVAMHLGYSPTAILPQMVNYAAAIFAGAAFREARAAENFVWSPGDLRKGGDVSRILILLTSLTFEHCAIVLSRVA
jgi:3-oxoacyl-[acyl-carrier-protein] synthase II